MTFFHVAGLLLLPVCGWLIGDSVQQKDELHLNALTRTIELLQRIRQEIEFRRADLQLLYGKLVREGVLDQPEAERPLQELPPPEALSASERECFAECMTGIGRAGAAQECERLQYYIARFQTFQQKAQQTVQARAGLPHKLGLAAGAVLALVFL